MRAYAALLQSTTAARAVMTISPGIIKPGSIDELIESYYRLVFPTLEPSTQAMRRGILERFRKDHGHRRVAHLEQMPEAIIQIIVSKAATPHAANNLRKVLRHLFKHAIALRMIKHNPVAGTERLRTKGDGHHTWSDAEIAQYRAYWPLGSVPRLVFELALELAARRAEIVTLGPQHERPATAAAPHGKLFVERLKGSNDTLVPISAELRAAIDACAPFPHLTYLATKHGTARSFKSLTGDFRKWCEAAGLPKRCRLHGLKKSALTALAHDGASTKEMQSISGHRSLAVLQTYIDKTDQELLAEQAMAKRSRKQSREQKAS
jgi:integrase